MNKNTNLLNKSDNEINQNDENFDNQLHKTSNDVKTNNVELSSISSEENQIIENASEPISVFGLVCTLIITLLILAFAIFTIYNALNTNIISGVSIKGIDVSNMSKSDAKYQLDNLLKNSLPEEIKVKHGDFEATISLSQIGAEFDTKTATNSAYKIGREGNIFQNDFRVLCTLFDKKNIEPNLIIDTEQLTKNLEDISTQLPDSVVQSSYYIEGNNLIITSGKDGNVIDIDSTIATIKNSISSLSCTDTPWIKRFICFINKTG